MKIYAVMYEKRVDDEYESGILDNKFYVNEMDANTRMLEEAQFTVDDWNKSPPSEFKLELFPKVKSCSIIAEFESDYCSYSIIELEDRR